MSKHILYISSWYPTTEKPTHGIFFKRHAEAAALLNMISVIHVFANEHASVEVKNENGVLTVMSSFKKKWSNVPLINYFFKFYFYWKAFAKGYSELLKHRIKPDLVQLNVIFPAGILALWLNYFKKIPFIIHEQWSGYYSEDGNYRGFLNALVTRTCVRRAKLVVVVSDKLENSMKSHGLINRYFRIGNAVDQDLFGLANRQNTDEFKFIHVSTLNDKEKNISGILQAAKYVQLSGVQFILEIVGQSDERAKFERLALALGVFNTSVFFKGFQAPEIVASMMKNADCFILNSNYEGLPCVVIEALACGLPVISTQVGGVPDIISDKNGILIPISDSDALAAAMIRMIANRNNYSNSAIRKEAIGKFSYPAIAKQFDSIYRDALHIHE